MWQTQFLFAQQNQVGRKHHASGVPGPMRRIERCVVLAQVRVAGVAKNRLHEIQIGNQAARREKPGLKRTLRTNTPNPGRDHGAQQQRHKQSRPLLLRTGEGDFHHAFRRGERLGKQRSKHGLGNLLFVVGNRQLTFHDMKHPLCGSPIAPWIVQHPLFNPVRVNMLRFVRILIGRERQGTGQAVMLQLEGVGRKLGDIATGKVTV